MDSRRMLTSTGLQVDVKCPESIDRYQAALTVYSLSLQAFLENVFEICLQGCEMLTAWSFLQTGSLPKAGAAHRSERETAFSAACSLAEQPLRA